MNNDLQADHEVFRKSKHSRWSVRSEEYEIIGNEVYASHRRCPKTARMSMRVRNKWSWFAGDDPEVCYGCGCAVPEYIQALVILQTDE